MVLGRLRRGPSVREDRNTRGRVLRRLGELNAGRVRGLDQPAAVQQSALRGGLSGFRDLLCALRAAYRSDTLVRLATFGTLHFPSLLSIQLMAFLQRLRKRRKPVGMSSRQHFPFRNRANGARLLADNGRHLRKGAVTPRASKGAEECRQNSNSHFRFTHGNERFRIRQEAHFARGSRRRCPSKA